MFWIQNGDYENCVLIKNSVTIEDFYHRSNRINLNWMHIICEMTASLAISTRITLDERYNCTIMSGEWLYHINDTIHRYNLFE